MIVLAEYQRLVSEIIARGYARDIAWAQEVQPPETPEDFAREAIFVICNSGMKAQVARKIFENVMVHKKSGLPASGAFGHKGKCAAIDTIWANKEEMFTEYMATEDDYDWLERLPWIGPITKYHLAKNIGVDCVKPDRHLVRIAEAHGTTPEDICDELAHLSGHRLGTVDLVLWRAANLGLINTRKLQPQEAGAR